MQINHKMYCLACNIPENNEKLCNSEPKPKATPSQCLFCQVSTSVVIKIKYNYSDDYKGNESILVFEKLEHTMFYALITDDQSSC